MPPKKQRETPTPVESIRHKDTRKNIPTEELRDFVEESESQTRTMLYPRDPSLDPQLVWKGKDEQDRKDLAVPVVPIYIQEKIHPQAIIDQLPRIKTESDAPDLFADFNGLPEDFDQRVDFYKHDGHWSNRMILGDSLLVMTSLAEKEGLKGKVQCIYIDPPYGIKFGSNWQVSTRKRDVKDGKAEDASRQPEQVRAFRDTWKLGIHSYLSYLRDRLVVARELLTESGSVFVQIGVENVHLVRNLLDEVFGTENFCSLITFIKTSSQTDNLMASVSDYLLWYAKDRQSVKYRQPYIERSLSDAVDGAYNRVESKDGIRRILTPMEKADPARISDGSRVYRLQILTSQSPGTRYAVEIEGRSIYPSTGYWKTDLPRMKKLISARRVEVAGNSISYVRYAADFPLFPITDFWDDTGWSLGAEKTYVVQTGTRIIERCLLMTTDPGDLILDPTCGSGTTAYVAEQWGRRWITCDTSRVALALARTRLMAARYPYYLLEDSSEGIQKEAELAGSVPARISTENDIRKGFVYKRVPHVTLKSIANNPEIHEGMTREEIDAAIARHADTELLVDQPYEDKKTVRVTGPFTVESLSPHRVLSVADDDMDGRVSEKEADYQVDFITMIIENLRKAGVQNTKVQERLKFDTLNPFAGTWLQASGEYTDAEGNRRTVAVSIGPEHGTLGPTQVKEAAKEAVQGIGFDLLLACGFAFDPHVAEEIKRFGKLTVLPVRMNPDLWMSDELLKKTGAGNLFMVFGDLTVDIRHQPDKKIVVEIKALDVYDPTTGLIRSNTTDEIACWFIDTNYNGESFFVRHAYFTGAEEPYDKLKRALRADIDEAAWSSLYSTTSRPFDPPETGKIAIKVINHYGDEVLEVFQIGM
ncbi:MAG TPA: site-specific DNA-methyltransferase [Candidatus Fermentibacter daniensis]|nr:site-specific DNA-methyltransferase [Candidatus Fermentibacter daniensis]